MKSRPFFSRRIPFFGNVAMLVLCAIFFILPFMMRGARHSIDSMENQVADWLPSDFPETTELRWFRDHFVGDQFVVISWDGCNEEDQAFIQLVNKLKAESVEEQERQFAMVSRLPEENPEQERERLRLIELQEAKRLADELGLHTTGDYHENWSTDNVKWLQGKRGQWYFINRQGQLFRWDGQNDIIYLIRQQITRFLQDSNQATGRFVAEFGDPVDNEYYRNPTLLAARFFKKVTTGPEVFEQLAGENGTLRVGRYAEDDLESLNARIEAHKRLSGVLFGPTPSPDFTWTWTSLREVIPEHYAEQLTDRHREIFEDYLGTIVAQQYGGDRSKLLRAPQDDKLEHWYRMWDRFPGVDAPPRQTCIVVTLNDEALRNENGSWELARAVGRPVLGKPQGRILQLATRECGIELQNLHMGGPPVDNVAIDEEGSITLFRLVSLSAFIGISLAWISFRSFRVTMMLFFVGGVAAMSSLAFVWFGGSTMDAVLMTMPSLVFVLGISGAVHIVNYYRDACRTKGQTGAPETAVRYGWFPCTLAAFTTSLGLISLCTSNLTPIFKFGLFSAVATLATVILLFTYLPASLTIWPSRYGRRAPSTPSGGLRGFRLTELMAKFWRGVGEWVIRHNLVVTAVSLVMVVLFAFGVTRIETSIQLLKLFRSDAKILKDYRWMEDNLGKLVPMELVISVDESLQRHDTMLEGDEPSPELSDRELMINQRKLSTLERMELSDRVRRQVLKVFGDGGLNIIGSVMSADIAVNLQQVVLSQEKGAFTRTVTNNELNQARDQLMEQDYLREEVVDLDGKPVPDEQRGSELWRISLRLAALNDIDYGQFVSELKAVVEPIMSAYRYRNRLIRTLQDDLGTDSLNRGFVLVLGPDPHLERERDVADDELTSAIDLVDQTQIFGTTFYDLLLNAGFKTRDGAKRFTWLDPDSYERNNQPFPDDDRFAEALSRVDCVVLIADHPHLDLDFIRQHARHLVDARDHLFKVNPVTMQPIAGMKSARQLLDAGDEDTKIFTAYTGIVPIVYKAQRTLLHSLMESIGLAFIMICLVMMILLRDWQGGVRFNNLLNLRGGIISMVPNVFPVVMIFGAMGHLGILVDIGSMMTASVAMGVAVDDTIHFMNWYRKGLREGKTRHDSIRLAYDKVATAMTQTTLIAGFGLAAFAFSTFMPTQRFGMMMLFLLSAALVGDLVVLPAILASPLGRLFGKERLKESDRSQDRQTPTGQHEYASSDGDSTTTTDQPSSQRKHAANQPLASAPPHSPARSQLRAPPYLDSN